MANLGELVDITWFVNPHLFWIINHDDVSKRSELEKELEGISSCEIVTNPRVGQYILLKNDGKWKRGITRDVKLDYAEYWLLDYGIQLEHTNKVYKLPQEFTKVAPIAKQAALKDVVCVQQIFEALKIKKEHITSFNLGSVKRFYQLIERATAISFLCMERKGTVHVGNLNLKNSDGIWYNVAQILVSEDVVAFDETLFNSALEENIQEEIEFMQATTNVMDLQNLLNHLEQYPHQGRGRGIAPCPVFPKLHSSGTGKKENNLDNSVKSEPIDAKIMKNSTTADANSSTVPKLKGKKSLLQQLRRLQVKAPTENSELDTSSESESKLNSSISSERSSGSSTTKEDLKHLLLPKENGSEKSSSSVKSTYSESDEQENKRDQNMSETSSESESKLNLSISSEKSRSSSSPKGVLMHILKLQEKKRAEQAASGSKNSFSSVKTTCSELDERETRIKEENASESSLENSSMKSEAMETSDSSYISDASRKRHFFDSDRRKCRYTKKFGCKCENCVGWVSTELYYQNKQTFTENRKKAATIKEVVKPPLLLKASEEKMDARCMKSYSSIIESKSKIQIATVPKILVHGCSFALPVPSINSVPFHTDVLKHMRKYEKVYSIQNYAWPTLMRSVNVCMVNPSRSGKTLAYMPAVFSYLLESDSRYINLPKLSPGPIVIILCPKIKIAENVYQLALQFLHHIKKKPVCSLAVPPMDQVCANQFKTPCDLLVTTPPMLVSLLNSRAIEILRLCHLVLEDCDKILDTYFDNMNIILNVIQTMLNNRVCKNSVQLITTAECWTPSLENLIKRIESVPVVYIGSFLEAALYGRADLQLSFVTAKQKVISLIAILENNWNTRRTLVLFNENSEIDDVKEYLQVKGITALCIYDFTPKFDVEDMETRWSDTIAGNHMVLLCTDVVFNNTLNISCACVLVHYSFPSSWTQFVNRFSCLIESYDSPLTVNKVGTQIRSQVQVFIDEDCNEQFSRLLKLLVRMGAKISNEYIQFYKQLVKKREQDNVESHVQLCPNVILFGECPSRIGDTRALTHQQATLSFTSRCEKRHMLFELLEKPSELPNCGIINYKILHIKNVSCITVKLLDWIDSTGEKHAMESYDDLNTKLKESLKVQKLTVGYASVNNSYVHVTRTEETYSRCVVLEVIKTEKITKRPSVVFVRYLDTGKEVDVETGDLYEIPPEFKLIPPQSVDLYIANMIPPHLDDSWSYYCLSKVKKLLKNVNYKDDGVFGNSRIFLRLGDVFWVDNVVLKENLIMTNATVVRLNLKKELLNGSLAACSENQLTKLYELCAEAGFDLPDYSLPVVANPVESASMQQAAPQWMHLDPDDNCLEIYITCIQTPDLFYVCLKKFEDLFLSLQKDIQKAIAKPFYKSEFNVEVKKFYLAKDTKSKNFCRVQVTKIDGDEVQCLYVDYGDISSVNKSDLKFLPDSFITKLPFQAIECRLHGISPALDCWQDNAVTIMDWYSLEPKTNILRTLCCNICATETAANTGGTKYSVILVDYLKKSVVVVNKQLIDCGEAVSLEGEDLDVDFVPFTENQEESSNENFDEIAQENHDNEQETQEECLDEDEPFFDFQVIKPELFLCEVVGVKLPAQPRAIAAKPPVPQLPQLTASPPSDHSTPKVVWHQTNTHIKLSIELIGVENFDLHVMRQKILSFKTSCNGTNYQLSLQLYDKVAKSVSTSNCGLQIRLTLEKCVPCNWPRLLHSTQKMNNIKYDLSKCEIDEDDENKRILDFGSDFQDDLSDGDCLDCGSGYSSVDEKHSDDETTA